MSTIPGEHLPPALAPMQPPVPSMRSFLRVAGEARYTDEYAVKLRRLFPWPAMVETHRPMNGFGVIWVVIEAGKSVATHSHDEEECFIIIEGKAEFTMNGETAILRKGDVIYIPRFAPHSLVNASRVERFVMIDIYWDDRSASAPVTTLP